MFDNTTISISEKLDVEKIRKDFPILQQKVFGQPLVYFDNAATTQKPLQVLDTLENYYREYNSNVHRGVHYLSQVATESYEAARKRVCEYINAKSSNEIIFTRGTTEGINLVAYSFGKKYIKEGDVVLISAMEHHSNIVPWQIVCEDRNAILKVIPMNERGELLMDEFEKLLTNNPVKIIAVTYVSNSLGTINPVEDIIALAHKNNIPVLLDAAQAVQHLPVDVQKLDVDFISFSGHKIYGPTGIGILYGKEKWLNEMPPYQGGGDMIKTVTFEKTIYNELPYKFEAGTPDVSGAIGLAAALDYVSNIGIDKIAEAEHELLMYGTEALSSIKNIRFIGEAKNKAAAISFLVDQLHPFDVGEILDKQAIAVRTGHHCTQPVMDFFKIPGTVRASLSFYNTKDELDKLVKGVERAAKVLAKT
jgi:cysteine desulfurase/selenocysteine lyase